MLTTDKFVPPKPLETAVLFLVFNRLDVTKQVFEAIKTAKPPRLYVAADGPRENKPNEAEKVKAVRDYVLSNVDWQCEVKTLFREKNLGCKYAVSGAITWFFENEKQGIILEDDCLPSQSFFWFCEELLERYKSDTRIFIISGFNKQQSWREDSSDYFYSKFGGIWGWASWRRAWEKCDIEMNHLSNFIEENGFVNVLGEKLANVRMNQMLKTKNDKIDTWDYPWGFSRHMQSGLACVPSRSLTENIGFGENATHTKTGESPIKRKEIHLPTKPNKFIVPDFEYDKLFHHNPFLLNRFFNKLRSFLNSIRK